MVQLLDIAPGRSPSAAWLKRHARLRATVGWAHFVELAKWIREQDQFLEPFGEEEWPDEVFRRFWKTAGWILEREQ